MHIDESLHSKDKTPCSTTKLNPGGLSLKALESLTQSARSEHLRITSEQRQNTLLLQQIRIGCAILKRIRISYAKRKQCSANDHFTGRTKHSTPPRNPNWVRYPEKLLESHRRRSSTDHLDSQPELTTSPGNSIWVRYLERL